METAFVINEYHILKQILSYLNHRDLKSASEVNEYWKSIADKIIQKNAECFCALKRDEEWPDFNDNIYPKLIFYFNDSDKSGEVTKLSKELFPDVIDRLLTHYYNLDKSYFLYLANWKFINTIKENDKLAIYHSCHVQKSDKPDQFRESLYMIPESDNLKINVAAIDLNNAQNESGFLIESIKSSTGCIILTSAHGRHGVKIVRTLLDNFERGGHDVTMAGGITHVMMRKDGVYCAVGGVLITFSGEKLTANSFVVNRNTDFDQYFSKMAGVLGPLEPGYVRIAFIFTCADIFNILGENETKLFSKYFPDVPLNGFWSLGEFCLGFTPLTSKRKKSNNSYSTSSKGTQFFFQEVSSYLFLTYKK